MYNEKTGGQRGSTLLITELRKKELMRIIVQRSNGVWNTQKTG
jgi:hypothetical protein